MFKQVSEFGLFIQINFEFFSPIHERLRRDSGKDNGNGADDHQQAFCYGFRDDLDQCEADVERCFDKLYHSYERNRKISHISINEGRCRCTVKAISF